MGQGPAASCKSDIWALQAECKGYGMKQAAAPCALPRKAREASRLVKTYADVIFAACAGYHGIGAEADA